MSSEELRKSIPNNLSETHDLELATPNSMPKALGIHWNVVKDTLHISTPVTVMTEKVTKRSVASDTAKIFDILGLRPCDHNSTGIASFTVEVSIEVG